MRSTRSVKTLVDRWPKDSPARLREVDLDVVRAQAQAGAHLAHVLVEEVEDELIARVVGQRLGRVHEAQRRGRDHRLLDRTRRIALSHGELLCGASAVAERSPGQTRHAAHVPGAERDLESVGRRVRKSVDRVRPEVVVLACSPSVTTGEPVSSKRWIVSRTAAW